MTPYLQDRIINRLVETGVSDEPWALAIVASLDGEGQLAAWLDGTARLVAPASRAEPKATKRGEAPGAYVSSVTVEGFRGIGPSTTLTLAPGPGLTLVVGRNGSGKSSFAEGLECLLTGRNYRWEKRAKVWSEGWRNLHHTGSVALRGDLIVEGQGTLTISRTWSGDEVAKSEASVKRHGAKAQTLESVGWDAALSTFRSSRTRISRAARARSGRY